MVTISLCKIALLTDITDLIMFRETALKYIHMYLCLVCVQHVYMYFILIVHNCYRLIDPKIRVYILSS